MTHFSGTAPVKERLLARPQLLGSYYLLTELPENLDLSGACI